MFEGSYILEAIASDSSLQNMPIVPYPQPGSHPQQGPLWKGKTLPYHVLKASKDSGSDDAQEQADDVEDGGRPEQVVEVDDVLATADIDVFIVPTSNFHPAGQGEAHFSQSLGSRLGPRA